MGLLRQFIFFFDNFTAPATLRTSGDPEKASFCTGIFSMFLVAFFTYIFIIKAFEIMTFQQVSANSLVEDELNYVKDGEIMFAMNVYEQHAMIEQNPYFEFQAYIYDREENIVEQITLKLCTLDQWEGVNVQLLKDYYDIEQWYCPEKPVPISGVRSNQNMTSINLKIDFCLSYDWCYSRADIENYIIDDKKYLGYLTAEFLIRDVGFTFNNQNASIPSIKYYKGTFTETVGTVLNIWLAEYSISTDTNMLPWEEFSSEKGLYVLEEQHFTTEYDADYNYLIEANLRFESKTMKVSRAYGKIDDILSYAGGLMGIVVGFFAFFLASFNEYKYELSIAEDCFSGDDKGNKIKEKDMSFFSYMGYVLFDWFKTLACQLNWSKMKKIDMARQEVNEQMSINFLYKKIQYLENMCKSQIPMSQAICLNMVSAPHIEETRIQRMCLNYHDQITQKEGKTLLQDIYPPDLACPQEQRIQKLANLTIDELKKVIMDFKISNIEEFEQVQEVQFDEDQMQAQRRIANAFFDLSQEKRGSLQGKYPVIILYRLMINKQMIKTTKKMIQLESASQKMQTESYFGKNNKVSPIMDASRQEFK